MTGGARSVAYRDLADGLRRRLRAGEWADGSPLPTELELSREHAVSRQTVRRAMQDLVADGSVFRVAGRGTFAVTDQQRHLLHVGSVEDLMGLPHDTELEVVAPLRPRSDDGWAAVLAVPASDVHTMTLVRRHDDVAYCLSSVGLPADVAALLADVPELSRRGAHTRQTLVGLIDRRHSTAVALAEQSVTAVAAPLDVQVHLGAAPGQPVLRLDRVYRDVAGRAVEAATSHFLPEHYAYRLTVARRPG